MEGNQYRQAAGAIVEAVGKDNISSATHCATRLRLIVKDKDRIDEKALLAINLVKGTFFNAGQYQIILGTGIVNKVYGEMQGMGLFGLSSSIIPDYVVTLVNVLTETAFAFLPALICWSAFKVFGGMPVIGLVIGLMLVSPSLPNAYAVADPGSVRGRFHGEEAEEDHAQCAGSNHDPIPGHAGDLPGGHPGNRPNHACGGVKAGDRGGAPGPSALWNQRFPHRSHVSPACNYRASSYVHHDRDIPFGQYRV